MRYAVRQALPNIEDKTIFDVEVSLNPVAFLVGDCIIRQSEMDQFLRLQKINLHFIYDRFKNWFQAKNLENLISGKHKTDFEFELKNLHVLFNEILAKQFKKMEKFDLSSPAFIEKFKEKYLNLSDLIPLSQSLTKIYAILRNVNPLPPDLYPGNIFQIRSDLDILMILMTEWKQITEKVLSSLHKYRSIYPKSDVKNHILRIVKEAIAKQTEDKEYDKINDKVELGSILNSILNPQIKTFRNYFLPCLEGILNPYSDKINDEKFKEIIHKVSLLIEVLELTPQSVQEVKNQLLSSITNRNHKFNIPSCVSLVEFLEMFKKDMNSMNNMFIEEMIKYFTRHLDLNLENLAVFKTGIETSRELLGIGIAKILELPNTMIYKEEIELKKTVLSTPEWDMPSPIGIVSAYTEGTKIFEEHYDKITGTFEPQALREAQEECLKDIDLKSFQEACFFLSVIGESDGHPEQFVVKDRMLQILDAGRHSFPGEGVLLPGKFGIYICPLLKNALLDMPQMDLPLIESFKQKILNYRMDGENGLQTGYRRLLLTKESTDEYVKLLEIVESSNNLDQMKNILDKIKHAGVEDKKVLREMLISRLKTKIEKVKVRTDEHYRMEQKSVDLQLIRIKNAREHIKTCSTPTLTSLMNAMYPDIMPFYYAWKKLGYLTPGIAFGITDDPIPCERIISEAKKSTRFTKGELSGLKRAMRSLRTKAIEVSDLSRWVDAKGEEDAESKSE